MSSTIPSATALTMLQDNSVPIETRRAEIEKLIHRGDTATVMAIGNADSYLSDVAVTALGQMKSPEISAYLSQKLVDDNPRVAAAALRSLAHVSGAQAVPQIATALVNNRVRPDGFQDMVCAAGVDALGSTQSSLAVPALAAELTETVGIRLNYDYGSQVVTALRATGSTTAVPALQTYRDRLVAILSQAPENPLGKRYLETKITEVDEALADLRKDP